MNIVCVLGRRIGQVVIAENSLIYPLEMTALVKSVPEGTWFYFNLQKKQNRIYKLIDYLKK